MEYEAALALQQIDALSGGRSGDTGATGLRVPGITEDRRSVRL